MKYQGVESYTDKSIFLLASGWRDGGSLFCRGDDGSYWSASLYTDDPNYARFLSFCSNSVCVNSSYYRYLGRTIRPVLE